MAREDKNFMTKRKKMLVGFASVLVIGLLLSATSSATSVDKAEASHLVSKADKKAKKKSVSATEEKIINDVKSEVENTESVVGEEEKKMANTLTQDEEALANVVGDEEKKLADVSANSEPTIEKDFTPSSSKMAKTTTKSSTKK